MAKKSVIITILTLLVAISLLAVFGFPRKNASRKIIENSSQDSADPESPNQSSAEQSKNKGSNATSRTLFVSGWIPYWAKSEGAASLDGNLQAFEEINPFAFEVDNSGNLIDKVGIEKSPWPELFKKAKEKKVRIVPTILWGDAKAMHEIFSNPAALEKHIKNIASMLQKNDFPGVDIDYEGKDVADRENFSAFLKEMHEALAPQNKTMSCTVEARTRDAVPDDFTGIRAMSFANDPEALDDYCDSVRIMAYDQAFQIYREKEFDMKGATPQIWNADNRWVEEVMDYFLKYIPSEKLSLGVATYGWEFGVKKTPDGYRYSKTRSVTYPQAIETAKENGKTPTRTAGGELSFTYGRAGNEHIVVFEDAASISDKVDIAKKLGLREISLFKIDGETDPEMFGAL